MRSSQCDELEKEYAKHMEDLRSELEQFPLARYSTTELKKELRRRKKGE